MKLMSTNLREHLDGDVTALCTCWEIERRDGVMLRFTDCDQDVVVDGNTFVSVGAYERTAIESTSNLSVDNLDVSGIATELVLPVEELRAGLYDHATVRVFMTSWMDAVPGILKLRRGFFGEVRVLPNGTFTVELRGIMQRLAYNYTQVFSATCRNDLGDSKCKVDIAHPYTTEGAHIPFPIKDSGFEDAGRAGIGLSLYWYNPLATPSTMISTSPTYSGSYAGAGDADGGRLVQDVGLYDMGEDFIANVDSGLVSLTCNAWRRDDGGQGRIKYEFLDYTMAPLRESSYLDSGAGHLSMPLVTINGDATVEAWISFNSEVLNYTQIFADNGSVGEHFSLGYEGGFLKLRVENTGTVDDASDIAITCDLVDMSPNVWRHFALTRSGTIYTIYVDGAVVGQGSALAAATPFRLARFGLGHIGSTLSACWDEIRVWDTCRTQVELNAYRFQDLPNSTPNLRRYYPFEDGYNDAGGDDSGVITASGSAALKTDATPVAAHFRGAATGATIGYGDVGATWVLRTVEDVQLPQHTRYVRVSFNHLVGTPNPTGTLVDSFFGYFKDQANAVPMPNFSAPAEVWTRAGMVITGGNARTFVATIDEIRAVDGWFEGGLVTFYSGKNRGASMEVKRWSHTTNTVELFLSLPYPVEPGDLFTIYPGCDKSRVCCSVLFDNILNFFGTPDIPGEDELFRYPDAK